jgi:hypothetical protein
MSSSGLNAEKISSANSLFEEVYRMMYEKLCPPNPPYWGKNFYIKNIFIESVSSMSLDGDLDDEDLEDLEDSFFYFYYKEVSYAVFYPFQDEDEVEVEEFLAQTATWRLVISCLEDFAEHVKDPEFIENVAKLNEKLNLLVVF